MKKDTKLIEEVRALRRAIKTYQEINKRTTGALVDACDELAKYKIGNACILCDPACKMKCKAMNYVECSTKLQIHFLQSQKEEDEDVSTNC